MATTNRSGARGYITVVPNETEFLTQYAEAPRPLEVGYIITAEDTGIVYQIDSTGEPKKVSTQS